MQLIKAVNQLVAFLLEIGMLISFGMWGFHGETSVGKRYLLGLGLPLLAAVLWGIWAAPKSSYRLDLPYRLLFSLTLFALSALTLHRLGHTSWAVLFATLAISSAMVELITGP